MFSPVLTDVLAAEFDPAIVTPGVFGFILTGGVALATVFLVRDMVRRVRRVNHRAHIAQLTSGEAESSLSERGSV